jgi:class 3 adenylate cyclase/Tfp pilus assembly protein PilF
LQAESSLSQNQQIDSLEKIIARSKKDTIKVDALLALAKIYFSENPKLSIKYSSEAESISKQLAYSRGSANALKQIGIGHYLQSEYFEAVQAWTAALSEFKKSKDIIGEANILSNLGAVYFNQADEPKALDYYLKSLQLAERTNDSLRLATVLLNIGGIYRKDPEKALEYFLRALPIARGIKDRDAIGTVTVNLGENYLARGEYQKALEYLNESLAAYESSENIPYSYILVGKVYAKMGNHDKALENQFKALEISKELNIQLHIAQALLAIGSTYKDKEDHENAIKYFLQGISVAEKINANVELKMLYEGVSNSYYKKKEFDEAYKFQNLLLGIKDSLYNNESDKKLNNLMFNYEIDKKESKITLLTKDKEIQQQVIQRQRLVRNSFIAGFAIVMIFAGIFFRQRNRISIEKQKSELLLLNILPEETAEELKATGAAKAKSFEEVTVLFTDFKDFTKLAEHLSPKDLVNEINDCFSTFDRIMEKYGIEKIKTIGDSYMAAGGLPTPNKTHASDVVKAAIEIRSFMLEHKEKKALTGESSFGIRIGVHTGPVVAGIVGVKKFQYDIWGDTVNTASRMESSGEVGKVNISGATYARIKDEFTCLHRGKIDAKNKGQIDMYFVEGPANA